VFIPPRRLTAVHLACDGRNLTNFAADISYFVPGWPNIAGDMSPASPVAMTPAVVLWLCCLLVAQYSYILFVFSFYYMSFSTVVSFSFTVYICVNKERQCLVHASPFCGLVVSLLKRWTCDSKGLGFDSRSFCFHVTTLSKLFTHVYLAV